MALILNIDTATQAASISLSKDGVELEVLHNNVSKDHASWIHEAIRLLMNHAGYAIQDLQAVAVSAGPGSYTGLRVGMATAKGFSYAIKIPFITVNSLTLMAFAAQTQWKNQVELLAPMIDARRMEVFTALYSMDLDIKEPAISLVLDPESFSAQLSTNRILFFGNGSDKWKEISTSHNAFFAIVPSHAGHLGILAEKSYKKGEFTDIVTSEPAYIKEFYTHTKK
jgi:tRNA threonylcarbamoyladenosine biosynthesis protein TsaB